jgi:hypothetical protein
MIKEIHFCPKIGRQSWRISNIFFLQKFDPNLFPAENWGKIAENCDHLPPISMKFLFIERTEGCT